MAVSCVCFVRWSFTELDSELVSWLFGFSIIYQSAVKCQLVPYKQNKVQQSKVIFGTEFCALQRQIEGIRLQQDTWHALLPNIQWIANPITTNLLQNVS